MNEKEIPYFTSIAVMISTRGRIKRMRHQYGPRKKLDVLEDVILRALDVLEGVKDNGIQEG